MDTNGLHVNQLPKEIIQKPLKHNHTLFIQAYLLTNNASEAVRRIGYTGKNARIMGYKLLNNPKIKAEIAKFQAKQSEIIEKAVEQKLEVQLKTITKDDFVDKAMSDYESLSPKESNRMKALELAGRASGIIGKDGLSTTNNNLIINVDASTLQPSERWDRLRLLIDGS